jgi:hypothetical protein
MGSPKKMNRIVRPLEKIDFSDPIQLCRPLIQAIKNCCKSFTGEWFQKDDELKDIQVEVPIDLGKSPCTTRTQSTRSVAQTDCSTTDCLSSNGKTILCTI